MNVVNLLPLYLPLYLELFREIKIYGEELFASLQLQPNLKFEILDLKSLEGKQFRGPWAGLARIKNLSCYAEAGL